MKHVISFGGSNSKASINKKLAEFAGKNLENTEFTLVDLNDFPLPLYGIDAELENGIPENALKSS